MADDQLGPALIWLIGLNAGALAISYQPAADQFGLMCELTRMIEVGLQQD